MAGANGSSRFPVASRTEFMPGDGVDHSRYFEQPLTQKALLDWLPG
jgi:hypothetical protein